jgi:hypothetical protein
MKKKNRMTFFSGEDFFFYSKKQKKEYFVFWNQKKEYSTFFLFQKLKKKVKQNILFFVAQYMKKQSFFLVGLKKETFHCFTTPIKKMNAKELEDVYKFIEEYYKKHQKIPRAEEIKENLWKEDVSEYEDKTLLCFHLENNGRTTMMYALVPHKVFSWWLDRDDKTIDFDTYKYANKKSRELFSIAFGENETDPHRIHYLINSRIVEVDDELSYWLETEKDNYDEKYGGVDEEEEEEEEVEEEDEGKEEEEEEEDEGKEEEEEEEEIKKPTAKKSRYN